MEDALIIGGVIAFGLAIAVPVLLFVRKMFRTHDPERALASVQVLAGSPFELPVPIVVASELYFRFEIDGSTDDTYDLAAYGEIEGADGTLRPFGGRTAETTGIDGAQGARWRGQTFAVTGVSGSILIGELRPGDRVVRGRVEEQPKALLRIGWVYVPKCRFARLPAPSMRTRSIEGAGAAVEVPNRRVAVDRRANPR